MQLCIIYIRNTDIHLWRKLRNNFRSDVRKLGILLCESSPVRSSGRTFNINWKIAEIQGSLYISRASRRHFKLLASRRYSRPGCKLGRLVLRGSSLHSQRNIYKELSETLNYTFSPMYNSVVKQLLISIKPFPIRMKVFFAIVVITLHPALPPRSPSVISLKINVAPAQFESYLSNVQKREELGNIQKRI